MAILDHLDLIMFAVTCGLLMCGFPVAFTLAGVALLFAMLGTMLGLFDLSYVTAYPLRIWGSMTNETLLAVPLFIFMGVMLERSQVAEELLESMGRLFGKLRGGLGISVTVVGALLAASTGIVGATVVTMGLLSLPTMLRRGYAPTLACGSICAAGTLGQIIPPSIVLVLLGDVISSSYQQAQLEQGIFSPETVSVGDLFAGALLPGLSLVVLYIIYQVIIAIVKPESSPPVISEEGETPPSGMEILTALLPPIILVVAVLGSILAGIATPTEAAAVGAVGALFLAGRKADTGRPWPVYAGALALVGLLVMTSFMDLRVGRNTIGMVDDVGIAVAALLCLVLVWSLLVCMKRLLATGVLGSVSRSTTQITSMVFIILVGAALFSLVFRGLGGDITIETILSDLPGGKAGAIFVVMLVMFILGFFLDFIEIIFVVVPLVAPVLLAMDVSPVWLGVMMAMNLQTSFLTPPFGFALFYLRGVAPDSITTGQIYRGAIPFVIIQIIALAILATVPEIATWLPKVVLG
jgi:tripartite ATP-independent transporter DctM subunit